MGRRRHENGEWHLEAGQVDHTGGRLCVSARVHSTNERRARPFIMVNDDENVLCLERATRKPDAFE